MCNPVPPFCQSVEQTSITTRAGQKQRGLYRNMLHPARSVGQPETIHPRELYTKHSRVLVAETHCLDIKHCR